jgi:hypothetical protein
MVSITDLASSSRAPDATIPPLPPTPPPSIDASKTAESLASGLTRTFGDDGRVNNAFADLARNPAIADLPEAQREEVLRGSAAILSATQAAVSNSGVLGDGKIDASELAELQQMLAKPVEGTQDGATYADAITALHKSIGKAIGEDNIPQSLQDVYDLVSLKPTTAQTNNSLNDVLNELRVAQTDGKITPDEYQRLVGSDAFQGLPDWVQRVVSNLAGGKPEAANDLASDVADGDETGVPKTDETTGATGEVPNTGEAAGSDTGREASQSGAPAGAVGGSEGAAPVQQTGALDSQSLLELLLMLLQMLSDGALSLDELEQLKASAEFQKLPSATQSLLLDNLKDVGVALSAGALRTGAFDDQDFTADDAARLLTDALKGVRSGDVPVQNSSAVIEVLDTLLTGEKPQFVPG